MFCPFGNSGIWLDLRRLNAAFFAHIPHYSVRREKLLCFSGCKSRPAIGSLRPVAIEAAAEATKPSEPLMERMERIAWRFREQAGRNASERRAGLEKGNAEADPPE
jgi:hypothetical protein